MTKTDGKNVEATNKGNIKWNKKNPPPPQLQFSEE
jgi:hypothetical protein